METSNVAEQVYKQLLEEIFTEIVFQVEIEKHFEQSLQPELKKYVREEKPMNHLDIFNNGNSKEANECVCPNCGRTLGALRFAPHLEKCVGMGRSSSRIASRRILASSNSGKDGKYSDESGDGNGGSQSQNNIEWVPPKATRRIDGRRKRDRNAKHKNNKKKSDDLISGNADENADCNYNNMDQEQRQNILANMCGVVSEHTGRLCTRSVRCPKHSDEQRNSVRMAFLPSTVLPNDFSKMSVQEIKGIEDIEMIEVEQIPAIESPVRKADKQSRPK